MKENFGPQISQMAADFCVTATTHNHRKSIYGYVAVMAPLWLMN
jgi:hypothetical protein